MLNSHAVRSFNRYNPNYNKHRASRLATKQEIKETIPKILNLE
jgi:hypothetical protein